MANEMKTLTVGNKTYEVTDETARNAIAAITGTVGDGDGYFYIGDLLIQWGQVNITTTANTMTGVAVTFQKQFGSVPQILVSGYSKATQLRTVAYADRTITGFTAQVYRTNEATMTVSWMAIGAKA